MPWPAYDVPAATRTALQTITQPRAQRTRDKILRHATRLLVAKGYHGTSLDEIERAAGVTTGAFFHHFESKEQLGLAVLDWYLARRREELLAIERLLPEARTPLEHLLNWLQATQIRTQRRLGRRQGGCVYGNLTATLGDTHAVFRRRLAECFDAMALDFKPRLDAAARRHGPRRKVDTMALARYIVSVLEGSILLARAHRDPELIGRHFDLLGEQLRETFR